MSMAWIRSAVRETDLIFGLVLSTCLGFLVGFVMGHPLGRLIYGSTIGATILCIYFASYSVGAIWLVGVQKGLLLMAVLVWCIILSSVLHGGPQLPLLGGFLG
jgi:hypothetical protein